FGNPAERVKAALGHLEPVVRFILGPSTILAFLFFGVPLARFIDIYPRKWVLGISIAVLGTVTALGGIAQSMGQFILTRVFVGAGTAANGPGSYSILSDAFRPLRIPLVFALLQLGY